MNASALPTDQAAVVGVIDPDAYTAATYTTDWIDAAEFLNFMAIIKVGAFAATSTIDAKLEQAVDNAGTDSKDVTDKAITQLTQADGDDDKQSVINLKSSDLDANGAFTHFRLSVTVAAAAADMDATVLGLDPRFGPASDHDASTVDEIVA